MEITAIVVAVIAAVSGFAVGFVGGQVDKLKAKVDASPNKIDDAVFALAVQIADRITQAKAEDPATPLGTPPSA